MMKCLLSKMSSLLFCFIVLLAVSCEKDRSSDEQNESLQSVTFKISGFSNAVTPFKTASKANAQASSNTSATQKYVEGKLYFWSFNHETLEPDIAFQAMEKPSIISDGSISYVAGYSFEEYEAGKSLSIRGTTELLIKIPIQGADQITQFGFDTGSSGTGPKDFELYYSLDNGISYQPLQLSNQFPNTKTDYSKSSFNYSLADKNITGSSLWFKFIPKEGVRGEAPNFNPVGGTWRFDNIRLLGMALSSQVGSPINKLHYFLFHKDKPELVVTGIVDYEEASNLTLSLAKGRYSICFIANESTQDLLVPEKPT
ncbi:MAG: hypothetical protein LBE37_04090, partial [Sphingobacterium sp.]|nr:hypothetical protein [Sphingobacterium sp.]